MYRLFVNGFCSALSFTVLPLVVAVVTAIVSTLAGSVEDYITNNAL